MLMCITVLLEGGEAPLWHKAVFPAGWTFSAILALPGGQSKKQSCSPMSAPHVGGLWLSKMLNNGSRGASEIARVGGRGVAPVWHTAVFTAGRCFWAIPAVLEGQSRLQYHFNLVCVLKIATNCNSTMTRVGRKSGLCALMTHVAATIPRLQITANIHDVQEVRLTFHNIFWCQCLRSFH